MQRCRGFRMPFVLDELRGTFGAVRRLQLDNFQNAFRPQEPQMIRRLVATAVLGTFIVGSAWAQTAAPAADKQETSCNTTVGTSPGAATASDKSSMAIEKSAILPSASGHANSAAPTVQQDGKAMQVRPDCPPDGKTK